MKPETANRLLRPATDIDCGVSAPLSITAFSAHHPAVELSSAPRRTPIPPSLGFPAPRLPFCSRRFLTPTANFCLSPFFLLFPRVSPCNSQLQPPITLAHAPSPASYASLWPLHYRTAPNFPPRSMKNTPQPHAKHVKTHQFLEKFQNLFTSGSTQPKSTLSIPKTAKSLVISPISQKPSPRERPLRNRWFLYYPVSSVLLPSVLPGIHPSAC
jgi:hypothetical protein